MLTEWLCENQALASVIMVIASIIGFALALCLYVGIIIGFGNTMTYIRGVIDTWLFKTYDYDKARRISDYIRDKLTLLFLGAIIFICIVASALEPQIGYVLGGLAACVGLVFGIAHLIGVYSEQLAEVRAVYNKLPSVPSKVKKVTANVVSYGAMWSAIALIIIFVITLLIRLYDWWVLNICNL